MPDNGLTTVGWIELISTIATPLLLLGFSGLGWFIQSRFEASQKAKDELQRRADKLEEEIRGDRLEVYNAILHPYIILLTQGSSLTKKAQQEVITKIASLDYQEKAFKLSLFASDGVVRAHNKLKQFSCKMEKISGPVDSATGSQLLRLFDALLLEIRKGVGNESTSLGEFEMLEWLIKDIESYRASNS